MPRGKKDFNPHDCADWLMRDVRYLMAARVQTIVTWILKEWVIPRDDRIAELEAEVTRLKEELRK
jgi:hypothetical protein